MTAGIDTAGTLGRVAGIAGHRDRVRGGLEPRVRRKLELLEDLEAAALATSRSLAERVVVAVRERTQAEQDARFLEEQGRFGRNIGGLGGIDDLRERLAVRTAEAARLTVARDAAQEKWTNLRRLLESCYRYLGLTT